MLQVMARAASALLSDHFFYFGKKAPPLPDSFLGLVKQGPGHRAPANAHLLGPFLSWVEKYKTGIHGEPQQWSATAARSCGAACARHDEEDEQAGCD